MPLDTRQLRYFIAVAEELHFTRAAERLGIAPPSLTQQIQSLERMLGAVLFHRTKRTVELSDAGLLFLEEARDRVAPGRAGGNGWAARRPRRDGRRRDRHRDHRDLYRRPFFHDSRLPRQTAERRCARARDRDEGGAARTGRGADRHRLRAAAHQLWAGPHRTSR